MSEKKDQEYFSDGLSEELIDLLTKVPDLRVPARTSSFYFKGQHATVAEIAKALSVAYLLEGSVRKAGNTVRVTAQLIRADNGYHLWSQTYDRDLKDVFKVQDEIAGRVVEELKVTLPSAATSSAVRTENAAAHSLYLLGSKYEDQPTPESQKSAIESFDRAIALDPGYAAAYAHLALSEASLADLTGDPNGLDRASAATERAITLAPDNADGYQARAQLRSTFLWDWDGANADYAIDARARRGSAPAVPNAWRANARLSVLLRLTTARPRLTSQAAGPRVTPKPLCSALIAASMNRLCVRRCCS